MHAANSEKLERGNIAVAQESDEEKHPGLTIRKGETWRRRGLYNLVQICLISNMPSLDERRRGTVERASLHCTVRASMSLIRDKS